MLISIIGVLNQCLTLEWPALIVKLNHKYPKVGLKFCSSLIRHRAIGLKLTVTEVSMNQSNFVTNSGYSVKSKSKNVSNTNGDTAIDRNGKEENLPKKTQKALPTAGIIVIGDEILKGQTLDINTHFLTQKLYKLGVKVEKVSVIPDDILTISSEVALFSKIYTHVITSGGIGPTHDDVTLKGVASAFNEKLEPHSVIVEFIQEWFKTTDLTSPAMKMAYVPESAVLHFGENIETGEKSKFPCIQVHNVTIFPGIPHLLRKSFNLLGTKLFGHEGEGFFATKLYFSSDEVSLTRILNDTVDRFPQITFGSYPDIFHSYYKTKVTLEALEKQKLKEAESYLKSQMDKDKIVEYISDTITDPWSYVSSLSPDILSITKQALEVLQKVTKTYSPEECCLCYNGGKDCLVVLHITHMYFQKHFPDKRIQAVYITENNSFPQVNDFVNQSINRYNLDCEIIDGPMKKALSNLLVLRPSIKAVIMGTRRVDPHGDELSLFSPTDDNWPSVMRVNPILEWQYAQVWSFIRQLFLPYCSLYDRGYTSLGSLDNTLPNPALERKDALGRVTFLPAFRLVDGKLERKGRFC